MSWRGIADLERGVRRSPYPATVRRLADALSLGRADRARLAAASGRTAASINALALRTSGIHPPVSSFVGREREISKVKQLLLECRLLTLTGSPGVGKTRLAYEAARQYSEDVPSADGSAVVELASVSDPAFVPHAVADALGITDQPGHSIVTILEDALRERQVLLMIDNCEHLLLACAALVDRLIRACPGVQIIATGRAALRIPGEVVLEVPPLSLPGQAGGTIADCEAIRLFVERCRALQPEFVLNDANTSTVAEICVRLDGLPLALELAAGRIRNLGLEEVAARLDDRLRLLTGGVRTAAPHQQTLRATLDWSYDLLSEEERNVLRVGSVFVGGADAETVSQVFPSGGHAMPIDVVSSLIEQSLVTVCWDENGRVRYGLLDSVREYALERLAQSGHELAVRARHADVYYKLVVGESLPSVGAEDAVWLSQLTREYANVRAAMRWFIDAGELEPALRLACATSRYWDNAGHVIEGRQWFEELLALATGRNDAIVLDAIVAAGHLARRDDDYVAVDRLVDLGLAVESRIGDPASLARLLTTRATARGFQGDFASARSLHEQAIAIWRQLGDRVGMATALNNLAIVCDNLGDPEAARAVLVECIRLARHVAPGRTLASALNNLGLLLHRTGNNADARPLIEESLAIARERRDLYATANALGSLGLVHHHAGDFATARQMFEESLALRRQAGDRRGVAVSLENLAAALLELGETAQAEFLLEESLAIFDRLHSSWGVADTLETMACVAAACGDHVRAEELLHQAGETRSRLGAPRHARVESQLARWIR
jgi:predicted ATPase/Tfp pilus assembly protein PilF